VSPLVSVITPTWQRDDLLLNRAIPSVLAQDYPAVEHVICSDGPNPYLADLLPQHPSQRYVQATEHGGAPHSGCSARRLAIEHSRGELITYCDDDDALRPGHSSLLAAALADPGPMFAVSRMVSHQPGAEIIIGAGPLGYGQVGTPMLMHRRELLGVANWGEPSACEDWELVAAWLAAGVPYVRVNAETSDVWPSVFAGAGS
jgi:hypothetical protein